MKKYDIEPASTRQFTPDEQVGATTLATKLQRVTYPDRAKQMLPSATPPGRINMREAKNAVFQRQMRVEVKAKPYRKWQEEESVETPLTVGMICDISGSMYAAQEPLGVSRKMITNAVEQVNGKVTAVLMGEHAHPIQQPGDRVDEVEIFSANDGWESLGEALELLEAAPHAQFVGGEGARLVIIITDGNLNHQRDITATEQWCQWARADGVAVVWLAVDGRFVRKEDTFGHGQLIDASGMTPAEIGSALGDAIIQQFREAAPQHSLRTL